MPKINPQSELVSSTQAAELLGVHVASIKRWADQGKLRCIRTPGGHRRFPLSAVKALGDDFSRESNPEHNQADEFRLRLFESLRNGQQMAAEAVMLEFWGQVGSWAAVGDAIGRLLEDMGRAWAAGQLNITDEHVASETLLRSLARLQLMIPRGGDTAPVCALATAPGDEHTLGLAMSELVLAEHGWRTLWLGRFTPVATLCETVVRDDVSMLAVSASAFSSSANVLSDLVIRVGPLAKGAGTTLVLGGSGSWPEGVYDVARVRSHVEYGAVLSQLKELP